MSDAVLFRSDAFSLEPTPEGDKVYDLPLGDDLAAFLRERLLHLRPGLWIDQPIREDWGTVLWVKEGTLQYYINVQWVPDAGMDNRWGISFSQPQGCLGVLLGRRSRPEDCLAMQSLVAQVVSSEPGTFRGAEWLSQAEYDARM